MSSMSVAGMSLMDSTGNPSTMNRGSLLCVMEPPPRTRIFISASGEPSVVVICTPASLPCIASTAEATGTPTNASASTVATDPVMSFFFTEPYPITTTSSRFCASSRRTTFSGAFLPFSTGISWDKYPMYEKTSTLPAGTFASLKLPSKSVMAPVLAPFTCTLTPISGSPAGSFTVPVTFCPCAKANRQTSPINRVTAHRLA